MWNKNKKKNVSWGTFSEESSYELARWFFPFCSENDTAGDITFQFPWYFCHLEMEYVREFILFKTKIEF